jgi:hypothetical protein
MPDRTHRSVQVVEPGAPLTGVHCAQQWVTGAAYPGGYAEIQGIRPMIEPLPLEKAAEGYDRMMSNHARFRVVLTTD